MQNEVGDIFMSIPCFSSCSKIQITQDASCQAFVSIQFSSMKDTRAGVLVEQVKLPPATLALHRGTI